MRTEQVKYFLETEQAGSFTKAAENLHIQQPSLREAIINLENELGGTLFHRSKKGVELSDFGRYCLPHFQLINESYEKMKQTEGLLLKKATSLNIDVQSSYETYLALFYNTLTPQLKETAITINTIDDVNNIANRLLQNIIDLAFILQSESGKNIELYQSLKANSFEYSVLQTFEVVALMKKDHPLAQKKLIDYKDLCKYKLVASAVGTPVLGYLSQELDVHDMNIIKTGSWKLVESYLCSQMAITFTAKGTNKNEDLVTRPLKDAPILTMTALYKKGCMNETILRSINVMKTAVANYLE